MHGMEIKPIKKRKKRDNPSPKIEKEIKNRRLQPLSPELVPDKCLHVTYADNLDSIMREGLNPRYGGTGASQGVPDMEQESRGYIHVSKNAENAIEYKRTLLDIDPSKKIIVLKVKTKEKNNWHEDPDDSLAIKTSAKIPVENIKIFTVLDGKRKDVPLSELEQYKGLPNFKYQFGKND